MRTASFGPPSRPPTSPSTTSLKVTAPRQHHLDAVTKLLFTQSVNLADHTRIIFAAQQTRLAPRPSPLCKRGGTLCEQTAEGLWATGREDWRKARRLGEGRQGGGWAEGKGRERGQVALVVYHLVTSVPQPPAAHVFLHLSPCARGSSAPFYPRSLLPPSYHLLSDISSSPCLSHHRVLLSKTSSRL